MTISSQKLSNRHSLSPNLNLDLNLNLNLLLLLLLPPPLLLAGPSRGTKHLK